MRPTLLLLSLALLLGCASRSAPAARPITPGFPVLPPIADADPARREARALSVPRRLLVERSADQIRYSVDPSSLETISLDVGHAMVVGYRTRVLVESQGQRREVGTSLGGSADIGQATLSRADGGVPVAGQTYVIEAQVVVFETDIPAQHMWQPEAGAYRELWSATLRSDPI